MPITRIRDESGFQAVEVAIGTGDNLQCSRVQDGVDTDAYGLWFFEPTRPLANGELAGKIIDTTQITGETVMLRFESSAAALAVINELVIIYGNLTKAGV